MSIYYKGDFMKSMLLVSFAFLGFANLASAAETIVKCATLNRSKIISVNATGVASQVKVEIRIPSEPGTPQPKPAVYDGHLSSIVEGNPDSGKRISMSSTQGTITVHYFPQQKNQGKFPGILVVPGSNEQIKLICAVPMPGQ
jgi:hypothetical protein